MKQEKHIFHFFYRDRLNAVYIENNFNGTMLPSQIFRHSNNVLAYPVISGLGCCPMVEGETAPIARFMGPIWGPSGADSTQVGPMLAPRTLLSGYIWYSKYDKLTLSKTWNICITRNWWFLLTQDQQCGNHFHFLTSSKKGWPKFC